MNLTNTLATIFITIIAVSALTAFATQPALAATPHISNVSPSPGAYVTGQTVTVTAEVTDADGGVAGVSYSVKAVHAGLDFSGTSMVTAIATTTMTTTGSNSYTADFALSSLPQTADFPRPTVNEARVHYYRLSFSVTDGAGNRTTQPVATFYTPATGPEDTSPPTISNPQPSSTVTVPAGDLLAISVDVSDPSGVAYVRYWIEGMGTTAGGAIITSLVHSGLLLNPGGGSTYSDKIRPAALKDTITVGAQTATVDTYSIFTWTEDRSGNHNRVSTRIGSFSLTGNTSPKPPAAPVFESITPAPGSITLAAGESLVVTVDAKDSNRNIRRLRFYMSIAGETISLPGYGTTAMPAFSNLFPEATSPCGPRLACSKYATFAADAGYNPATQTWTLDFGPSITDLIATEGSLTLNFELTDQTGKTTGSTSGATTTGSVTYQLTVAGSGNTATDTAAVAGGGPILQPVDLDADTDTDTDTDSHSHTTDGGKKPQPQTAGADRTSDKRSQTEPAVNLRASFQAVFCDPRAFDTFLHPDYQQSRIETLKLQLFLGLFTDRPLHLTGTYDSSTVAMVKAYQRRHRRAVLAPWSLASSTGYVYLTTTARMNAVACGTDSSLPAELSPDSNLADEQAS